MSHRAPHAHIPLRAALLLGTISGLMLLSGCDGDPAGRTITNAERLLNQYTAGGQSFSPFDQTRITQLQGILESLRPYLGVANTGQARAANLMSASASAGLGELQAAQSNEIHRLIASGIERARAMIVAYQELNGSAQASERYNPAGQITDLLRKRDEVDRSIADKSAQRKSVLAKIAELNAAADDLTSRAKTDRVKAASTQQGADGLSATDGLKVFEEAARIRRGADAMDAQASGLRSQVGILNPEAEQLARDIASLTRTHETLDASVQGLRTRGSESQKLGKSSRADADAAASAAVLELSKLIELRDSTLMPALDKAVSYQREAVKLSAKAQSLSNPSDAGSVRLAAALHQQGLGRSLLDKARSVLSIADVLEMASDSSLNMPGAQAFAAQGEAARRDGQALLQEARATLDKAVEVYESAKEGAGSDLFKTRLGSAIDQLKRLGEGRASAKPAPGTPAASSAEPVEPNATSADPQGAAREWADAFHKGFRAMDPDAVVALYHANQPGQVEHLRAALRLMIASVKLDEALTSKFGQSASSIMGQSGGAHLTGDPDKFRKLMDMTSSDYDVTIVSPTEVTLVRKDEPGRPKILRPYEGRWLADAPSDDASPEMTAPLLAVCGLLESLAADVQSGKIHDPGAFKAQLVKRLAAVTMSQGGLPGAAPGSDDMNK